MIIGSLTLSTSSNCWISSAVSQSVSVAISLTHSVQPLIRHHSWCSVTLLLVRAVITTHTRGTTQEAPRQRRAGDPFWIRHKTLYIPSYRGPEIRRALTGCVHGGRTVRLPTVPHLGRVRHPSLEGYSSRGHESNESENALRSDSQSSTTSPPNPPPPPSLPQA